MDLRRFLVRRTRGRRRFGLTLLLQHELLRDGQSLQLGTSLVVFPERISSLLLLLLLLLVIFPDEETDEDESDEDAEDPDCEMNPEECLLLLSRRPIVDAAVLEGALLGLPHWSAVGEHELLHLDLVASAFFFSVS